MPESNFISRVVLRNYKSIRHCDVRLGQIAFLVGPNGAGKSNFVEALRFLSHALSTSLEAAVVGGAGFWNLVRGGQAGERRIAFELWFQLGIGTTGKYRVELESSSPGPPAVAVEECWVEAGGSRHWFRAAMGKVESNQILMPAASEEKLFLVNASGLAPFEPVYRALSTMEVYNPVPRDIREFNAEAGMRNLDRAASGLGEVVSRMKTANPERFERVIEYLQRINPAVIRVDTSVHGSVHILRFQLKDSAMGFTSQNMSDGTLRALAVLVALFQENERYPLRLIGLEEPEAGLHPAAAGVLFDALMEGSLLRQVVVTSHSPDLLDRNDIPEGSLKAVVMENGQTYVGEVDEAGKQAMKDRLYTAGELLRMDQLRPAGISELADIG